MTKEPDLDPAPAPSARRIEAKELRAQERKPIQDIVPIRTPFVVYIDPTNVCNFRCTFCPTGDPALLKEVGRPIGYIKDDLFDKIVSDLKKFPDKLKLVSMYKDGEPTLNKAFPDMIRKIRDADVTERIWTKTNGSRLEPKLNQRLVDSGLDLVCISIESTSTQGYKDIAKVDLDYDRLVANVADLYGRRGNMRIYVKIADTGISPEERAKFYADFEPIATEIAVEKLMGWSYSGVKDFTLGTNPDTYDGLPLVDKEACAYPFYVMAVNSDGSVSLCGNDWSHGTVVGNVKTETLPEIWEGEALYQFRRKMLSGHRCDLRACADCYYLKIVPDNIDAHRTDMLRKLEAARPG